MEGAIYRKPKSPSPKKRVLAASLAVLLAVSPATPPAFAGDPPAALTLTPGIGGLLLAPIGMGIMIPASEPEGHPAFRYVSYVIGGLNVGLGTMGIIVGSQMFGAEDNRLFGYLLVFMGSLELLVGIGGILAPAFTKHRRKVSLLPMLGVSPAGAPMAGLTVSVAGW